MVEITDRDLDQALENFEQMIEALERYRASLEARRARYEAQGRDPKTYASVISGNLKRIDRLEEALEGDVYDLLRHLLDGSGVLASVDEGRWI
jgi:DNA repair exonuclease SbcCD ATPase subunit